MSSAKDKYYWNQLRAALTAGQWSTEFPAKAPNGTPLSWSELFRKFNKHCKGYTDVAEVASQTHALSLLLAANSKDQDQDDAPSTGQFCLDLADECVLPQERIADASVGYETLKKMESSNIDTLNLALAYYAYALGDPTETLSHLSKVPDISHVQSHIPVAGTTRSMAGALQVPSASAEPSTSSAAGSFISDSSISFAEIKDGRAWAMTESLRSICLQGMSHEKLYPTDPQKALRTYGTALPLLAITESEFASNPTPLTSSGKFDFSSFTRFRELWRWVERLLWRAIVLAAQTCNIHSSTQQSSSGSQDESLSLWVWLGHYTSCSSHWPSNFHTWQRSTVSVLYLRALIVRYGNSSISSASTLPNKPPPWLHAARSVVQEYRAILSISTRFPRAGERNVKVEDFVDLCVAVWEASGAVGEYAGWVLDVLWWATRMTFNSFRVLRHMTRLLHASGDTALAKRTLKLYVQVVGKAWQTSGPGDLEHTDTDQNWVETLVAGVRMLCSSVAASPGAPEGLQDARDAGKLVEKLRTRLDTTNKVLAASVDLAEGVWCSVFASKERDPHARPRRLAAAHALFLKSVELSPTPAAYYHLALSFTRPGPSQDLEQAILNAGLAVEGDPKEIRHWHLLGILLTATEQWKAAQEILDKGADIGEDFDEEESSATENGNLDGHPPNLSVNPNGGIDGLPGTAGGHPTLKLNQSSATQEPANPVFLLEKGATDIPPASELLMPALDHCIPSRREIFEHALQLRMTQVALTEYVEGAERAEEQWLEVFSWVAEKRGVGGKASVDSSRPPTEVNNLKSPSELVLSAPRTSLSQERPQNGSAPRSPQASAALTSPTEAALLTPIPITISPATPDEHPRNFSIERRVSMDGPVDNNESLKLKRSFSSDRDTSKSKKVQQMFKNQVHKGHARISTISKKVVRNGTLRRSNSTPDFHAVLRPTSYQASSIHSRRHLGAFMRHDSITPSISPPPPPPPPPNLQTTKWNNRTAREARLESDLWLMSAATFRRLGKIEQAKGAIQEAEVKDEGNALVWVQLGLYYVALGNTRNAIDALQKALFINPDEVAASIHLCRLWLTPNGDDEIDPRNVDLAAGMLTHLTRGPAWDVPEAWYFLAKAYGMQDRKDRERECLSFALTLSEKRGVREVDAAVGWCI